MVAVTEQLWKLLRLRAHEASAKAYAPYSNYRVGVAALSESGQVYTGCNVENASYGLTLCAECSLISALIASGGGSLRAVVCTNASGEIITPCGRCRQLLWEHAAPGCEVLTKTGAVALSALLPDAFDRNDLSESGASGG